MAGKKVYTLQTVILTELLGVRSCSCCALCLPWTRASGRLPHGVGTVWMFHTWCAFNMGYWDFKIRLFKAKRSLSLFSGKSQSPIPLSRESVSCILEGGAGSWSSWGRQALFKKCLKYGRGLWLRQHFSLWLCCLLRAEWCQEISTQSLLVQMIYTWIYSLVLEHKSCLHRMQLPSCGNSIPVWSGSKFCHKTSSLSGSCLCTSSANCFNLSIAFLHCVVLSAAGISLFGLSLIHI